MNLILELNKRLKQLSADKIKVENALNNAPEQRVSAVINHGTYQYYLGHKYLRKTEKNVRADITKMIEGEYNREILKEINRQIELTREMIDSLSSDRLGNVYRSMNDGKREMIMPLYQGREEYIRNWEAAEYDRWEITECNGTEMYTIKNERVRSKSEKIIADELYRFRVPYKYEYPLQLKDQGKILYKRPDFVALNRTTLKMIVIEHLGRMADDTYEERNYEKIDLYERNGYMIGDNLLLLHETESRPLNIKVLDQYIELYLM